MMLDIVKCHLAVYRRAGKSLARPTSRCNLFDGENISFNASLVLYIYIYICVCVHIYVYIYIYIQIVLTFLQL